MKRLVRSFVVGFIFTMPLLSQLPTASEIAREMKVGWNIVNTLEAPAGETTWGNPRVDQTLINAVRNAGFNTIRIPCAWDSHANKTTMKIDTTWLIRVGEVVDYCLSSGMYVILNCHWDNGWLENNVTEAMKDSVNKRQRAYWTQIAEYFKDVDEHLLFAGANEPNVNNTGEMAVLLTYHQTFIDAVRSTGGNNSSRVLVIQGPSTDIDKTNSFMNTLPVDQISNRLMVEIHYYTPWNFCGLESDASWGKMFFFWGAGFHSTTNTARNATWGEESAMEGYFQKMKTKFIDKGIPVILGEYGAVKRTSLTGNDLTLHLASREYFFQYVTNGAIRYGMIPYCWDNGIFNRTNGDIRDQGVWKAIMNGAAAATSVGESQNLESRAPVDYVTAIPNPVSSNAKIQFSLHENTRVEMWIYNMLGQQVARFHDLPGTRGLHSVSWNPGTLTNGTYFIKARIGSRMLTNKIMLVR